MYILFTLTTTMECIKKNTLHQSSKCGINYRVSNSIRRLHFKLCLPVDPLS